MDLSKLNQLDPKLKETYERVMGTATPHTPKPKPFIPIKTQVFPQNQPIPQAQPVQMQPIQKPQTQIVKKKSKMLSVFLVLGGVIFLIVYTFFWIKIVKLKLPFLPF